MRTGDDLYDVEVVAGPDEPAMLVARCVFFRSRAHYGKCALSACSSREQDGASTRVEWGVRAHTPADRRAVAGGRAGRRGGAVAVDDAEQRSKGLGRSLGLRKTPWQARNERRRRRRICERRR